MNVQLVRRSHMGKICWFEVSLVEDDGIEIYKVSVSPVISDDARSPLWASQLLKLQWKLKIFNN